MSQQKGRQKHTYLEVEGHHAEGIVWCNYKGSTTPFQKVNVQGRFKAACYNQLSLDLFSWCFHDCTTSLWFAQFYAMPVHSSDSVLTFWYWELCDILKVILHHHSRALWWLSVGLIGLRFISQLFQFFLGLLLFPGGIIVITVII